MTILVCGEALFDVFVARRKPAGFDLDARLGGSAFNVAVGLARLGRPVGLLTGVSRDVFGEAIVSALEREGVDRRFAKRCDAPTTIALVATAPDGSPSFSFRGEGAADRQVEDADLPDLEGIEALVFGCFSILTRPTGDSFLALARSASGSVPVVLDPNIRLAVEPDAAVWRARVEAFAALADIVKASAEDLEALGYGGPEEAARRLMAGRASLVVMTRGGEGASAFLRSGAFRCPAPAVEVVDTVGAGDTFLAGLLAALAEAGSLSVDGLASLGRKEAEAAVQFAAAAAAIACSRRGADPPARADVMAAYGGS